MATSGVQAPSGVLPQGWARREQAEGIGFPRQVPNYTTIGTSFLLLLLVDMVKVSKSVLCSAQRVHTHQARYCHLADPTLFEISPEYVIVCVLQFAAPVPTVA